MRIIKRLIDEEHGHAVTEYTLALGLVVLGFWMARKSRNIRFALEDLSRSIKAVVDNCC